MWKFRHYAYMHEYYQNNHNIYKAQVFLFLEGKIHQKILKTPKKTICRVFSRNRKIAKKFKPIWFWQFKTQSHEIRKLINFLNQDMVLFVFLTKFIITQSKNHGHIHQLFLWIKTIFKWNFLIWIRINTHRSSYIIYQLEVFS